MAGFPGWLPSDGRFCIGASGATRCKTSSKAVATSPGGSKTGQYIASSPCGRSTCAALRAPSTGSTQCQACPATTASKDRPLGFQISKLPISTSTPVRLATSAIRASGSTPSTVQPAALYCRAPMPVPQPTSRNSTPGLAAMTSCIRASGQRGPARSYRSAFTPKDSATCRSRCGSWSDKDEGSVDTVRVYVLCLDRTPALPAVAHLAHFNLDVTKSRREQAIRQCLRRNRVAGVAEMHFKYWYKGNY